MSINTIEYLGSIFQARKDKIISHMKKLEHKKKYEISWDHCLYCKNVFYYNSDNEIGMFLTLNHKDWNLFWQMDASEEKYRLWQTLPCPKLREEKEKFLNRLKEL